MINLEEKNNKKSMDKKKPNALRLKKNIGAWAIQPNPIYTGWVFFFNGVFLKKKKTGNTSFIDPISGN
jgi:hypothetical protein